MKIVFLLQVLIGNEVRPIAVFTSMENFWEFRQRHRAADVTGITFAVWGDAVELELDKE